MSTNNQPPSPWKKPNEVMELHRLKMKKRSLQARFKKAQSTTNNSPTKSSTHENITNKFFDDKKRRNPFAASNNIKRKKLENCSTPNSEDLSSDNTLFKLLNLNDKHVNINANTVPKELPNIANTINQLIQPQQQNEHNVAAVIPAFDFIPIDWTLKTKMRIISKKPFKWSNKLRTSEEASGITGFVRCLDTTTSESLDTSMSARCYQCCLVWQHPSLPWLSLFPRTNTKISNNSSLITNNPQIVKSLHTDWIESFRSLFQLVRAKQCPYFYFCANTFTVLFRAAGIGGFKEIHALITPTTRGFRHCLKQEDIEFTMPLKKKRLSSGSSSSDDLGYDTLDSNNDDSSSPDSKQSLANEIENMELTDGDDDDNDDNILNADEDQWLKSLGVDASEIERLHSTQKRKLQTVDASIDNSEQSLVCVQGVEAQALFNFLMNCKSSTSIIGPLAGIPPTLLAPVAFRGATLNALKVRENKVIADDLTEYYSIIITGPILPHTIHMMANLLTTPDDEYSATFENIENTTSFSKVTLKNAADKNDASILFDQENLTDCGLPKQLIKHFCSINPIHTQIINSIKFNGDNNLYSCT